MECLTCTAALTGRQQKYCSKECARIHDNAKYQNYQAQQARGKARKAAFISERGGGCEGCGYNKYQGAIDFHHKDPKVKAFNLDIRSLSNRTLASCVVEFEKCEVLCANCHREKHS